jgi:cell division protein FtsL
MDKGTIMDFHKATERVLYTLLVVATLVVVLDVMYWRAV